MDTQTVAAYDTLAETFAREWREQPAPDDLYALLRRVFKAGGDTVDIGCGAGREVAWLNANGYPAVGYDASAGLLEAARTQYPGLSFRRAMLP
ncbi:class I SAM-dependent methyltransferase, partial [Ralstonia pseudosolanacearum]